MKIITMNEVIYLNQPDLILELYESLKTLGCCEAFLKRKYLKVKTLCGNKDCLDCPSIYKIKRIHLK